MNTVVFRNKTYNIIGFYRYPSYVSLQEKYNWIDKKGNKDIETLYKECANVMETVERKYNLNFFENKTAFVLEEQETKQILYVGSKDLHYTLGQMIRTETDKFFDFTVNEYKAVNKSYILQWR